jgi:hypothetical protein
MFLMVEESWMGLTPLDFTDASRRIVTSPVPGGGTFAPSPADGAFSIAKQAISRSTAKADEFCPTTPFGVALTKIFRQEAAQHLADIEELRVRVAQLREDVVLARPLARRRGCRGRGRQVGAPPGQRWDCRHATIGPTCRLWVSGRGQARAPRRTSHAETLTQR